MAVTLTIPDWWTQSIYDDIWVAAISSASGQTDLKYVLELYDENNVTKIFEAKIYPEPTNKYMYFNVAPILRNHFSERFFIDTDQSNYQFTDNSRMDNFGENLECKIRIGTDYSGITTLNEASGITKAMKVRPKYFNRRYKKVSLINDIENKWQTDRKMVGTITKNSDNLFIGYRCQGNDPGNADGNVQLSWESFDEGGNLINSDGARLVYDNTPSFLYSFQKGILNIGPDALNRILPIDGGTGPDINNCAYYTVQILLNTNNDGIYTEKFKVIKNCESKYKSIPIHFWNRYHSVDTMRFDLVSRTTVDVERKSYNQREYRFDGNNVPYTDPIVYAASSGNTIYRENKINYNATYNYTMKLTSDLLDDQDWEWLEDLIESPKIYMEEDGYFYPVTIKATNYEISKYINNRLRPLEIEIEFNSPRLSGAR